MPPRKRHPASPKPQREVERIVSIPEDVVLSPQSELPRHLRGSDHSGVHRKVRELSWMELDRLVQGMAQRIRKAGGVDVVVGVAHGGVFVGGALAQALKCDFYPVRLSPRSRDKATRQQPRMAAELSPELCGKRLLIVDDVAASGETLELARSLAAKVGAKETQTACLVTRPDGYTPHHSGTVSDEFFVFPWDYDLVDDGRFDL